MIIVVFEAFSDDNQRQSPSQLKLYLLRRTFKALFPHGWDFIEKETPDSDWKTVKKYKLTERKQWYKYTDTQTVVGVRFGTNTLYGLYDIDWGSKYDPREQERSLNALRWELEEWGIIRIFFIQSSWSGGLHLYFYLRRAVSTFRLACIMNRAAEAAGLEVKRGQLETFPNTKNYGNIYNGHRLPLQQGSFLLDKDYVPYSDRLEDFISAAEWSAEGNDVDLLESRLEEAYDWFKVKKYQERYYEPTPEDKEFIEQVDYCQREINEGFLGSIRLEVNEGFTGYGETNELLLAIAKLGRIFYGYSGQRYIDYIKETITSCPGYAKYCRHQHEIDKRCAQVARFGEKQWFPYRTQMADKNRYTYDYIKSQLTNKPNLNNERQHNARSRIIQAIQHIEESQGGLPQKVGECKLVIRNVTKDLFGVSVSDATLKKPGNINLWHPRYRLEVKEHGGVDSVDDIIQHPKPNDLNPIIETPVEDFPPSLSVIEVEAETVANTDLGDRLSPCDKPSELDDNKQSTVEPNQLEVSDALNTPQQSDSKLVLHQILPLKGIADKPQKKQSTPLRVVRQNEPKAESLKAMPSLTSTKTVHTLPYMKGMMRDFVIGFIYQILQKAYFNLLMGTPNLELLYQGYRGFGVSGFVEIKGEKPTQVQLIKPNTEVEILRDDYHSTAFRDNPKQLLVYIKPLHNSDWLNGIAVLIDHLIPLRFKDTTMNQLEIKPNQSELNLIKAN
jgi:hypothetical protein